VVLYVADGSPLTSRWDVDQGQAIETDNGVAHVSDEITREHLRALAEIRESNGCANWFTNAELTDDGPHREDIDWRGFPGGRG
jgi:hypothetical protein